MLEFMSKQAARVDFLAFRAVRASITPRDPPRSSGSILERARQLMGVDPLPEPQPRTDFQAKRENAFSEIGRESDTEKKNKLIEAARDAGYLPKSTTASNVEQAIQKERAAEKIANGFKEVFKIAAVGGIVVGTFPLALIIAITALGLANWGAKKVGIGLLPSVEGTKAIPGIVTGAAELWDIRKEEQKQKKEANAAELWDIRKEEQKQKKEAKQKGNAAAIAVEDLPVPSLPSAAPPVNRTTKPQTLSANPVALPPASSVSAAPPPPSVSVTSSSAKSKRPSPPSTPLPPPPSAAPAPPPASAGLSRSTPPLPSASSGALAAKPMPVPPRFSTSSASAATPSTPAPITFGFNKLSKSVPNRPLPTPPDSSTPNPKSTAHKLGRGGKGEGSE